jgi:hypothetical protein
VYATFNQSAQFSVIIYNQDFIHGATPSLVLSFRQSAFLRSLGSAKHQPSLQRRGYAQQCNSNLLYEVSRPIFRRPLLVSYNPLCTSTEYIIVLRLEQYKFICSNASVSLLYSSSGVFA